MYILEVKSELGARFSAMSLICAVMVVCLHMGSTDCMDSSGWWFYVVGKQICKIAVPWFFLASGFFLVGHCDRKDWYSRALKTRIKTLLVPYLFWCGLFAVYFTIICARKSGLIPVVSRNWLLYFGLDPVKAPFCSVMWYLRALMIFILISPAFIVVVRRLGWWAVGFLWLADCVFRLHYGMPGSGFFWFVFSLEGAAYFALGIAIRLGCVSFPFPALARSKYWGICGCVILLVLLCLATVLYRKGHPVFCYEGVLIPFAMMVCWRVASCVAPFLGRWGEFSFPLYLVHVYPMNLLTAMVFKDSTSAAHLLLRIGGTLFLSALAIVLIRRFAPKLSAFAFGGR